MLTFRPIAFLALFAMLVLGASTARADQPDVFATYGVHNPPEISDCKPKDCVYQRQSGEPTDPEYPTYWVSNWTMYRVFNHFAEYPPPYAGKPPPPMKPGVDYEVSHGTSYYDSTWRGPTGEGAMMEHYEKRCLPIFAFPNHYSCSFISLGDVAFFLTYADRPPGMPPVCLFSPVNHPPRRDFIKHLPYAAGDSAQLGGNVQGYSFWLEPGGGPVQTGVKPDRTNDGDIMFGYAFDSRATPDRLDHNAPPYRHPQSFYFSGVYNPQNPAMPPDAPFVSQNYTDFAMIRPNPAKTWAPVAKLDIKTLPACELFNPPLLQGTANAAATLPSWGSLGKKH
jgi:hypothetical protein